jgi:hypothetical protein
MPEITEWEERGYNGRHLRSRKRPMRRIRKLIERSTFSSIVVSSAVIFAAY